jgi:exonuclease SbcC
MMLIRSIHLKNVRSYNGDDETRLELPEGVVLLEGDIGSGKSSLLYALEFALFGFSDLKGPHLLSEGKREGHVHIAFESGGVRYSIHRSLRAKGDDVVQEDCYIDSQGRRTRLSPSDLKERVVSILGFNEPTHPRAESMVYRYAVFTPQEKMKEILSQNPEERLHVIRRVLGAQSYQVAADNSDLVKGGVKQMAYGFRRASEDLKDKKDELEEKSRTIAQLELELVRLQKSEADSSKAVKELESEWKDSRSLREGLVKSEGSIPVLEQDIEVLQAAMEEDEESLTALEAQAFEEIEPIIRAFEKRPKPESKASDLQVQLDGSREKLTKLEGLKESLEAELTRARDLLSKGVCPLCGQLIPGDLPARSKHSEQEITKVEADIAEATRTTRTVSESLEATRNFEESKKEYATAVKDRTRVGREIEALRKKLKESTERLSIQKSELKEANDRAKAMREVSRKIEALESRLEKARRAEREASLALTETRTKLADSTEEVGRLSEEVERKQKALSEAKRLTSYETWLSAFFRPTVELIEKQTLTQAAARFNEHFQRFFTALVDDPDMVVRVKENFSPLFEREGFEQDYEALSGGERTSMALAYRFALNSVIRESLASQPELVILDEPTDGFSREQVYKMRTLLEELDSKQVILVSHEKELESMADHIFRVEKRNGTSEVSRLSG